MIPSQLRSIDLRPVDPKLGTEHQGAQSTLRVPNTIEAQIRQEIVGFEGKQQRCGLCNDIGHNSRTCKRHQEPTVIN